MEEKTAAAPGERKRGISKVRASYVIKFIFRIIVLTAMLSLYLYGRFGSTEAAKAILGQFDVLEGFNFFRKPSVLHILWIIWIIDMIVQLIPRKGLTALGSKKLFKNYFIEIKDKASSKALRSHIRKTSKGAYIIFAIWAGAAVILGALYFGRVLKPEHLFLVSVAFYVCDLICVLFWCPFRLMVKATCCTTCRIFNWDHLMMFTPMLFLNSFYSITLVFMAFITFFVWEAHVLLYPERFWTGSNKALQCSSCTDKLCTQYCQKKKKASQKTASESEKKTEKENAREKTEIKTH